MGAGCVWLLSSRSEGPPGEAKDGETRSAGLLMAGTAGTKVGCRNELATPAGGARPRRGSKERQCHTGGQSVYLCKPEEGARVLFQLHQEATGLF